MEASTNFHGSELYLSFTSMEVNIFPSTSMRSFYFHYKQMCFHSSNYRSTRKQTTVLSCTFIYSTSMGVNLLPWKLPLTSMEVDIESGSHCQSKATDDIISWKLVEVDGSRRGSYWKLKQMVKVSGSLWKLVQVMGVSGLIWKLMDVEKIVKVDGSL